MTPRTPRNPRRRPPRRGVCRAAACRGGARRGGAGGRGVGCGGVCCGGVCCGDDPCRQRSRGRRDRGCSGHPCAGSSQGVAHQHDGEQRHGVSHPSQERPSGEGWPRRARRSGRCPAAAACWLSPAHAAWMDSPIVVIPASTSPVVPWWGRLCRLESHRHTHPHSQGIVMHRKLTSNRTPRSSGRRALVALLALFAALLTTGLATVAASGPASAAIDPCGAGGNKISCENSKPGTAPSVWDIDGAGDDGIQGFATDISVNVGQQDRLQDRHRRPRLHDHHLPHRLLRGPGGAARSPRSPRRRRCPSASRSASPTSRPSSTTAATGPSPRPGTCRRRRSPASTSRCSTAPTPATPATSPSSSATTPARSAVVFQTSDPTWQAYNTYGGSDFYQRRRQRPRLQDQLQPAGR